MTNKMKVIDLYNLMFNKKDLPEKIKVNEQIFTLRQDCDGDYWYGSDFDHQTIEESQNRNLEYVINLDVEIIEEIEKPKEIKPLNKMTYEEFKMMNPRERFEATIKEYDKIDKMRYAVNYLLKKEDDKSE